MFPSNHRSGTEAAPQDPPPAAHGTLPPPEWTGPKAPDRPEEAASRPLPRRTGRRAEEAWLRARVEEARAARDGAKVRLGCAQLARWLASRDRDLDEAVELAAASLQLGQDIELRRELSAWLESLGEPARAAAVLKSIAAMPDIDSGEVAYALVRVGLLRARAGAAAAGAAAFEAALSLDGADPLPAELLATLGAWQPEVVPIGAAVEAHLESARRRASLRQDEAEILDLWRAFAVEPSNEAAAGALAESLDRRGRVAATDEVWRAHAQALALADPPAAARVHARRRLSAGAAGDPARALGAALDEGLAAQLEGEGSDAFESILLDLGMLEALAVRLELRAERTESPSERADQFVQLGRLCAGPLADQERAAGAYRAALAADPACDEALGELRGPPEDPKRDSIAVPSARDEAAWRPNPDDQAAAEWARASFGGSARTQAEALERVAAAQLGPVRAVLLAVAADRHLAAGNATSSGAAAELATRADPTSARCAAALAEVAAASHHRDRQAAAALERAIGMIGPRPSWCAALADAFDALGQTDLAAGWSQRCVTVQPGDRSGILKWLERLVRSRDASRLRDALAWLLTQPQPSDWTAEPFARALSQLAHLDPERAAVIARRALDVFGPKSAPLREAMLGVAERAAEDGFAVAVLERWLSAGAGGSDRRAALVRVAELRFRLGDDEGEARVAARALREGLRGRELDEIFGRLAARAGAAQPDLAAPGPSADAELWCLRANAERLGAGDDVSAAAWAFRDLGAALWDLADDRVGAVDAWQRTARTVPGGYTTLAHDLVAFAGAAFAFDYLARVAETEPDDPTSTAIAAAASRAALSLGHTSTAFALAARALARSPSSADAIAAAEQAAQPAGEQAALSALYDRVAAHALGRFGRRAAHYRGARFFERSADHALALKHAAAAFHAVPSAGSTFQFLARAAERAGDRSIAIRTVEQVAEREPVAAVQAGWLLRAANITGDGEEGARRKVDVLLRALASAPSVATIRALRVAAHELLRLGPEQRDGLELRVGHAVRTIGGRVEGPEGARIALGFAVTLLDLFGDADGALACVERAFACDADVEDFGQLATCAPALGQSRAAHDRVAAMLDRADEPHANVGVSALRLLASVAAAAGDDALRSRAWIAAALREPGDDSLVVEADSAVRMLPALAERIAGPIPTPRRAAALLAAARARVAAGAHSEAAPLLERAADLLDPPERAAVERELRAALDAAGRGSEIEARAYHEASEEGGSPSLRADGWMEVAELRERRGDHAGAVKALIEACRLDPAPLERWSALERVGESAGDDGARITALESIEARVRDDGRATVLKRLARVHERRGDLATAEQTWLRVLALDNEDEEADQAIQSVIVARGDYEELAGHLARRAERLAGAPEKREILRAVRLRRAAILEQRLGRTNDACLELELLLREWPDSVGALRYLADLYDRQSDYGRSVPLWRRAAAIEENPSDSDELELRAARAAHAAGDAAATREHATRVLARHPTNDEALALRMEAARALGADADLGEALDVMAARPTADPAARAGLLLQSAQAAVRSGDLSRALDRARAAVAMAPERAAPQLLARALEYRQRGSGAPDEARQTIEELSRIVEPLGTDDAALRAFLLAEALDVVQGGGAGMRELEATLAVSGDHALIALGRAERLAAQGQYPECVDVYRAAVAGSLLDVRRPGPVAVAAADAALRAGLTADTVAFLDIAERHEDARHAAQALREKVAALPTPVEPTGDVRIYDLEAAVHRATTNLERATARLELARGRLDFGDVRGAEPLLWEALADGLIEAGDVLAPVLASSPDRIPELVRVRWQQVALEPGDIERLESLRAAALAADDRVHARGVEHVMRAFDPGAGPLPPPPLASQPEQPGLLALLVRPSMDAAGEALALLWEGAMQLFVRDAASYRVTGMERIVPGPSSPIGRLYEVAMRVLGVPRVPLFVTRPAAGPVESQVALLSPPSVILAGDVRQETAELRFELGRALAAALPQNVLRLALPKAEGHAVVDALRTAFGTPELGRQVDARVARLAESFWQIIPASAQRRLQELLRTAALADYGELVESALQSGRRVGMFLSGDFGCAARALLAESAVSQERPTLENLRALCVASPVLADLLRLAVRSEYADARWHSGASASHRRAVSSGRFSLF
jgi:cellulose synthase operon protein C